MYVLIFLITLFVIGTSCLILDSFIKPKKIIIKKPIKKYYDDDDEIYIKEDLEL